MIWLVPTGTRRSSESSGRSYGSMGVSLVLGDGLDEVAMETQRVEFCKYPVEVTAGSVGARGEQPPRLPDIRSV
ncbi:MAG: hypothetical protein IPK80_27675 [Nannocystis sp.]|nr:hypothetical protein [Nannocystis sp.]